VTLHPSDVAQMGANHPALANAVGGLPRLGSIGRFLKTKLNDPNFRAKAFDVFGMFLGSALPQFQPAIDLFLGQLGQGAGNRATLPPPANDSNTPIDPGSVGGRFEGQLNANGGFTGRFTPDQSPAPPSMPPGLTPPPPPPPVTSADPLTSIEAVARALGATILSKDSSGIRLKTTDGREVKFGPDGRPIP